LVGASPRERLGEQLRGYRRKVGLSQPDLAERLGTSQSTVSKIETGKARVDAELARAWLAETGATDDDGLLAELLTLAESGTSVTDWATLHAGGWEIHQSRYEELERTATRIRNFQNAMVPGLLQTAAYSSFLLTHVVGLGPDQVGSAVTARLERQQILWRPTTRIRVVLTEAVIRHRLGGPSVMVEQLGRLSELAQLPTVELGIVPADTDMPSRYGASFDLFEQLDGQDESVVIVELEAGEVRETEPDRVARYTRRHDLYWSAALTGTAATDLISGVAGEIRRSIFG
jgi:transcriptional regulator with XRE-family HTH domain